ncbi:MAG: phosphonate ABC transporter, permease protein PhnE [Ferruginibacter sp.]|nr:phosphonate ABC transporter, permease protein PhnE [Cytophagales bacterium]
MNLVIEKPYLPSQRYKRAVTYLLVFLLVVVGLCGYFGFDPRLFITDFHYLAELMGEMTPPNFEVLWRKEKVFSSILQTISMAFLGTLIGGTLAMGLAFLAAGNTSPHPAVRAVVRTGLSIERGIPNLVIILVFLIAVGLGPFAGMLSLVVGTVGVFGKLFADAIEGTDGDPAEAVYAVGATKWQVIQFGIIPQVLPSFIANLFYAFDINLRAAIGLGVFGGAGIGYEIHMAMKLTRYQDGLALIFFTIVLISLFEKVSDYLRRQAIGQDVLK